MDIEGHRVLITGGSAGIGIAYARSLLEAGCRVAICGRDSERLAAAEKTLEILDETNALESIADYGRRLQAGLKSLLSTRGIPHCFVGHPSMGGMFFSNEPPHDYRDWVNTDYAFYEALAPELHDNGVLCEPDSREPWFVCEAHDEQCLSQTLERFERALDTTLDRRSTANRKKKT